MSRVALFFSGFGLFRDEPVTNALGAHPIAIVIKNDQGPLSGKCGTIR
jgi:hypothetical protein